MTPANWAAPMTLWYLSYRGRGVRRTRTVRSYYWSGCTIIRTSGHVTGCKTGTRQDHFLLTPKRKH